jgi:hypothetical protein
MKKTCLNLLGFSHKNLGEEEKYLHQIKKMKTHVISFSLFIHHMQLISQLWLAVNKLLAGGADDIRRNRTFAV